jgi:hypothetical protein
VCSTTRLAPSLTFAISRSTLLEVDGVFDGGLLDFDESGGGFGEEGGPILFAEDGEGESDGLVERFGGDVGGVGDAFDVSEGDAALAEVGHGGRVAVFAFCSPNMTCRPPANRNGQCPIFYRVGQSLFTNQELGRRPGGRRKVSNRPLGERPRYLASMGRVSPRTPSL